MDKRIQYKERLEKLFADAEEDGISIFIDHDGDLGIAWTHAYEAADEIEEVETVHIDYDITVWL